MVREILKNIWDYHKELKKYDLPKPVHPICTYDTIDSAWVPLDSIYQDYRKEQMALGLTPEGFASWVLHTLVYKRRSSSGCPMCGRSYTYCPTNMNDEKED